METKALDVIRSLESLRNNSERTFDVVFGSKKDSRYDKTQFCFSTKPACHNLHNVIYFCHHKGVYGDSNVGSAFSDKLAEYIARAIDEKRHAIFNRALELITSDIKGMVGKLKADRDELDKVIQAITDPDAPQNATEAAKTAGKTE